MKTKSVTVRIALGKFGVTMLDKSGRVIDHQCVWSDGVGERLVVLDGPDEFRQVVGQSVLAELLA